MDFFFFIIVYSQTNPWNHILKFWGRPDGEFVDHLASSNNYVFYNLMNDTVLVLISTGILIF